MSMKLLLTFSPSLFSVVVNSLAKRTKNHDNDEDDNLVLSVLNGSLWSGSADSVVVVRSLHSWLQIRRWTALSRSLHQSISSSAQENSHTDAAVEEESELNYAALRQWLTFNEEQRVRYFTYCSSCGWTRIPSYIHRAAAAVASLCDGLLYSNKLQQSGIWNSLSLHHLPTFTLSLFVVLTRWQPVLLLPLPNLFLPPLLRPTFDHDGGGGDDDDDEMLHLVQECARAMFTALFIRKRGKLHKAICRPEFNEPVKVRIIISRVSLMPSIEIYFKYWLKASLQSQHAHTHTQEAYNVEWAHGRPQPVIGFPSHWIDAYPRRSLVKASSFHNNTGHNT